MKTWIATPTTLKFFDYFKALNEADLAKIAEGSEIQEYDAGEIIVRQGEPSDLVYFIIVGAVKMTRRMTTAPQKGEESADMLVRVLKPGDSIGDITVLVDFDYKCTHTTALASKLLALKKTNLAAAVSQDIGLAIGFLKCAGIEFLGLLDDMDITNGNTLARIDVLTRAFAEAGVNLNVHFSKADIARMLGLSRVLVSQTMNKWRDC